MAFRHGVTVTRATSAVPRPLAPIDLSTIGLLGTATGGTAAVGVPVAVRSRAEGAALFGTDLTDTNPADNTIPRALADIFAQGAATVVVCKMTATATRAATVTAAAAGGFDLATGKPKGVDIFDAAEEKTGLRPGILIAPDLTHRAVKGTANALAPKMEAKANTLRAIHLVDGLPISTAALAVAGDVLAGAADGGARGLYLWPWLAGPTASVAPSASVAGLIARVDAENGGPWASPSNHRLSGYTASDYPVPYDPSTAASIANTLNNGSTANVEQVTTFVSVGGLRLWGNRVATPTDPAYGYVSVLRTADLIELAIQRGFLWAVDRNITTGLAEAVIESVNDFLRDLTAREGISGGEAFAHPELNTKSSQVGGKAYVAVRWSALYPAEELAFTVELTEDYVTVFGGAAEAA